MSVWPWRARAQGPRLRGYRQLFTAARLKKPKGIHHPLQVYPAIITFPAGLRCRDTHTGLLLPLLVCDTHTQWSFLSQRNVWNFFLFSAILPEPCLREPSVAKWRFIKKPKYWIPFCGNEPCWSIITEEITLCNLVPLSPSLMSFPLPLKAIHLSLFTVMVSCGNGS